MIIFANKSGINMKRIRTTLLLTLISINNICAQTNNEPNTGNNIYESKSLSSSWNGTAITDSKLKAFKHLDVGVTLGSTGVGIEFSSPINNIMQLRGGFSIMPKFEYDMVFELGVGKDGNMSQSRFEQLAGMLEGFTGYKVDDKVDAIGEPTFHNFNLMMDFFPFKNKKWHLTAGFHVGPSKIAEAVNAMSEMPSLLAVGIYNTMYEKAENDEPVIVIGDMAIYRPDLVDYGRMGMYLGRKKDGSVYMMEPDEESIVHADMKVNSFKPYIGFGYGDTSMSSNKKYTVSFDCGIMLWGGRPKVVTHDGTDLIKDMEYIVEGNVKKYVDIVKKVKVFPVLNVKITRKLF